VFKINENPTPEEIKAIEDAEAAWLYIRLAMFCIVLLGLIVYGIIK
jgi:hypothetical protein